MFWHLLDLQVTDRNLTRLKRDEKSLEGWTKEQSILLEEIREVLFRSFGRFKY